MKPEIHQRNGCGSLDGRKCGIQLSYVGTSTKKYGGCGMFVGGERSATPKERALKLHTASCRKTNTVLWEKKKKKCCCDQRKQSDICVSNH